MADPHVVLAPIVEPPLPPLPAAAPPPLAALPLMLAGAAVLLALMAAAWGWRRGAPRRALRRIARHRDVPTAAQQLARWQQAHWTEATPAWQQALDRLRFGPPEGDAAATLQALCVQAAQAGRPH